ALGGSRGLGRNDSAGLLQPGQGRINRPERHVGQQAQVVPQLPADLVAVEVALFEEAQNGHVQHCGSLYRIDIAMYSKLSPGSSPGRLGRGQMGCLSRAWAVA